MDSWQSLTALPSVNTKWDRGSWLANDDAGILYAHQAKHHGFYPYNLDTQTWGTALTGMPLIGVSGKSRKSKDGGSAAYFEQTIFALKGGNTQEFWRFTTPAGSWAELETVPQLGTTGRKKKVKNGADITATTDELFALKGNKTNELWQYVPGTNRAQARAQTRGTVMARGFPMSDSRLAIAPNPLRSGAAARLTVGAASLQLGTGLRLVRIYDATGRPVHCSPLAGHHSRFVSDVRSLRPGVYLVSLRVDGVSALGKLVVTQ
jgi:hypothetical protein